MRNWRWRGLALASMTLMMAAGPQVATAAAPESETVWANGQAWTMLEPRLTTDPSPQLLASAGPEYVLAFPQNPDTHAFILPAGYAPQCDPCLGVPVPVYHDHLLAGAPGYGSDGTAGAVRAPHRPILMVYNPRFVASGHFRPVTDARDLPAAIADGEFLPIGGEGVYEKPLPAVIVGAVVAKAAG